MEIVTNGALIEIMADGMTTRYRSLEESIASVASSVQRHSERLDNLEGLPGQVQQLQHSVTDLHQALTEIRQSLVRMERQNLSASNAPLLTTPPYSPPNPSQNILTPLAKIFLHNCANVEEIKNSGNLPDDFPLKDKDQNKVSVLIPVLTLRELNTSDPAALVVDRNRYVVLNLESVHTLVAPVASDLSAAILRSKNIEAPVLYRVQKAGNSTGHEKSSHEQFLFEYEWPGYTSVSLTRQIPLRPLEMNSTPPPQINIGWCIHVAIKSSPLEDQNCRKQHRHGGGTIVRLESYYCTWLKNFKNACFHYGGASTLQHVTLGASECSNQDDRGRYCCYIHTFVAVSVDHYAKATSHLRVDSDVFGIGFHSISGTLDLYGVPPNATGLCGFCSKAAVKYVCKGRRTGTQMLHSSGLTNIADNYKVSLLEESKCKRGINASRMYPHHIIEDEDNETPNTCRIQPAAESLSDSDLKPLPLKPADVICELKSDVQEHSPSPVLAPASPFTESLEPSPGHIPRSGYAVRDSVLQCNHASSKRKVAVCLSAALSSEDAIIDDNGSSFRGEEEGDDAVILDDDRTSSGAAVEDHIGAQYYSALSDKSARDMVGYGIHIALTAAGRIVKNASFYGIGNGGARGRVPSARIAAYKVCNESSCSDVDILAAFDDAIAEGVDIIIISIGADSVVELNRDVIAIGAFHAMAKGVLTSHSAGNSGPSARTINSVAPWLLSVAASNTDRRFFDRVVLGNGAELAGVSIYSFTLHDKCRRQWDPGEYWVDPEALEFYFCV